jgi:hypothetical protein
MATDDYKRFDRDFCVPGHGNWLQLLRKGCRSVKASYDRVLVHFSAVGHIQQIFIVMALLLLLTSQERSEPRPKVTPVGRDCPLKLGPLVSPERTTPKQVQCLSGHKRPNPLLPRT